jgi:hypothetical protein
MWVVKGKTTAGKTVEYKVPAGKDTDKAFVLALAFQEHGTKDAEDPLTTETVVTWTSDNVTSLPNPIVLSVRINYGLDRRVAKGEWERWSDAGRARAFRSLEAASEALESAASEYPGERFRISATTVTTEVVAVSRNAVESLKETPDKPKEEVESAPAESKPNEEAPAKKAA